MNLFQVNENDLQFLFESAGQNVYINDKEKQAIISNPAINEYEQRYIHTLQPISQGDIVTLDNERYLVIIESLNKRNAKYKALMRHCNYVIEIPQFIKELLRDENGNVVYDSQNRPVYKTVQIESVFIPSIIDNKNFSIDGQQLRVPINQIIVVVQDNLVNRDKLKLNDTFTFEGKYKVLNRDFTKKGLIILTCESTT